MSRIGMPELIILATLIAIVVVPFVAFLGSRWLRRLRR
jgi:hypothetical protein